MSTIPRRGLRVLGAVVPEPHTGGPANDASTRLHACVYAPATPGASGVCSVPMAARVLLAEFCQNQSGMLGLFREV